MGGVYLIFISDSYEVWNYCYTIDKDM